MTYEEYFQKIEAVISSWDKDEVGDHEAMGRIYDIGIEFHKSDEHPDPDCDMPGDGYP